MRTAVKFLRWAFYQTWKLDFSFGTEEGSHYVSMPGNWSSLATYIQNYRDPGIQLFIRRSLPPGSTFVDVGANIGTYTVPASAAVGPNGKVIAIEPHPFIFEYLKRNVAGNQLQNVLTVNAAVGATRKNALMRYEKDNPGQTHVISQFHAEATKVPMARLDDILSDLGIANVAYLKIDVEGYELYVLRGAKRIIDGSSSIIIQIELVDSNTERYGHPAGDAAEFLFSMGFLPHAVDRFGVPHALSKERLFGVRDSLWSRSELSSLPIVGCA